MRALLPCLLAVWAGLAAAQPAPLPEADVRAVVDHLAGNVIAPTYGAFAREAAGLQAAVDRLAEAPSEAALTEAREAWRRTRSPWEQAEAFLFGPVDLGLYDPTLDTWPLNVVDLEAMLASEQSVTAETLASAAFASRGFHAVEYLLGGEDGGRAAASFTDRELAYLRLLADELARASASLHDDWSRPDGYASVLRAAGTSTDAVYPTVGDALYELLMGVLFIADEVQAEKLGVPLDAGTGLFAESRFSGTSADDIRNNLRSMVHVYTGTMGGAQGPGIGSLVATVDPALDARFRAQLDAALAAVDAIPGPLRDAVESHPEAVGAARDAVVALVRTLEDALVYSLVS